MLCSGMTMRRTAKILSVSYMTVYQKFLWLSLEAKAYHQNQKFSASEIQFDETLSIEHTKLKPLSIAIAVSKEPDHKYKILDVKIGTIPAYGDA